MQLTLSQKIFCDYNHYVDIQKIAKNKFDHHFCYCKFGNISEGFIFAKLLI